jgi:galactitol PTS system EIIA component
MPSARILDLLVPSAVCVQLEAATAAEVITILGQRLEQTGHVRDTYVQAALDREAQLPTGLPLDGLFNVAIPHTDVEHVLSPALALATLTEPVDFQNMIDPEEGIPVRLVILMAMNEPKSQVDMLQEIAGVLQDAGTIEKLVEAANLEEIFAAFA